MCIRDRVETDDIGFVKCRQPVDANANASPECRFAVPGVFNTEAIKHLLEPVSYTHLDVYKRQPKLRASALIANVVFFISFNLNIR